MRRLPLVALGLVTVLVAVLVAGLVAGLTISRDEGGAGPSEAVLEGDPVPRETGPPSREEMAAARSTPREDSYYPDVGDPGVDSWHHDLELRWDPGTETLEGVDTLTFRSTTAASRFQLDLGEPLTVSSVTLDGAEVGFRERGDHLVVRAPVEQDAVYEAVISYAGTPEPTPVPTRRPDFSTTGWTTTPAGEVWTMQEPFGAFTWYPVNDHPSDEALYDLTISVPSPWVGVSNGLLQEREEAGGRTVTRWHVDEPVASYLMTIAIGEYEMTEDETASGVPVTYWTSPDDPTAVADLRATIPAMAWVEERLGPYPFSTLGLVVVPSQSAMETQTMITLGDNAYVRSPAVILHELVHQWYGNQVTPSDWRDLWMNEGMATYLQLLWEAEDGGQDPDAVLGSTVDAVRDTLPAIRRTVGPPGRYDPDYFADSTVYTVPAAMWHELRVALGDEAFWAMVRAWPASQDNQNPTRRQYLTWIERQTGKGLTAFLRGWLGGRPPDVPWVEY